VKESRNVQLSDITDAFTRVLLPHDHARGLFQHERLCTYFTFFLTYTISTLLARFSRTTSTSQCPSLPTNYLHPTIQNPSLHSPRRSHVAPPWVTFDSIAYFNGSCANGADPDIASLGVLVSSYPYRPQLTCNRSSSPSCSLA
jgi:hypothetical protein